MAVKQRRGKGGREGERVDFIYLFSQNFQWKLEKF
jgi:hypothetical protein